MRKIASRMIVILTLAALSTAALSGCGSSKAGAANMEAVSSTDKTVTVSVPKGWKAFDTNLYNGAVIGRTDSAEDTYVLVLKRAKSDLPAGTTIDSYLKGVESTFDKLVSNPSWGQSSKVKLSGLDGLTVQLTGIGKSSKKDFAYSINIVEDKSYFYQLDTWTVKASAVTNKAELDDITGSLKIS